MDKVPGKVIFKVKSSNVLQFGYDPEKKELRITFHKNGTPTATYAYYGVPNEIWTHITEYKGKFGSYVRKFLKGYKFQKINI